MCQLLNQSTELQTGVREVENLNAYGYLLFELNWYEFGCLLKSPSYDMYIL